jgi:hypothetical protein
MTKDELLDEFVLKFNDLCDLLTDMNLNPLADFESLKMDSEFNLDEEDLEDGDDGGIERNEKDSFEY